MDSFNNMGMQPMGGDASFMPPQNGDDMGFDQNMMNQNNMGGDNDTTGGDPMAVDGDEGFDMGIGMSPEDDGRKWIEGASAKLAGELRKFQKNQPSPDMALNKTAVNTVAAATKENLKDGQKDELMSSYAETMRSGGDDSDGGNGDNYGSDIDPNAPDDGSMDMGDGSDDNLNQNMMEMRVRNIVNELVGDLMKMKKHKKPSSKTEHNDEGGYVTKPFKRKM